MTAMKEVACPAVLIAAPASGQGKTTLTAVLARLHARAGRRVRVFKCGPDFLDPHWHALASGASVHQIDLWMTGEDDIRKRLHAAAQEADLILVEGVMGLFDGEPSAADLARRFGLPVLAVINASSMAGTFGALAHGLQHYRPGLPWAGVLANQVGSERHAQMLQDSLDDPAHWLGALRRDAAWALPERHLGLTVAGEIDDALQRLDAAADVLRDTPLGRMDLGDLQRWAVNFAPPAKPSAPTQLLAGCKVAVARDRAFCFIYDANLDTLRALGADVLHFSPLAGEPVPDCDALWLPGGYPELHAQVLGAQHAVRASLLAHVEAGRPVWAECGGMMALFEELETREGEVHAMWGLLPGRVTMQKRLAALGPQQLALPQGTLRGHTFHYSTAATSARVLTRTARPDAEPAADAGEALYQRGSVRASYFHAWFASAPVAAASLFLPEGQGEGQGGHP
jgi:cobyrinic acid a,c-diamide synthase